RALGEELRAAQFLAQRGHTRLEVVLEVEHAHAPVEPVRQHAVKEERVRVLERVREHVAREVEAVVTEEIGEQDLRRDGNAVAVCRERPDLERLWREPPAIARRALAENAVRERERSAALDERRALGQ